MMEEDREQRIFNLQIQIQKMEEELTLYRNGASGQELFEVIGEKNTEINELKSSLAGKTDNLKTLAKSSTEVIEKYSALQDSFEQMKVDKRAVDEMIATRAEETASLQYELDAINKKYLDIVKDNDCKQEKICDLERELVDANVVIEKLHKRGATLVAEKSEKSKLLDKVQYEKAEMEQKNQAEIAKLIKVVDETKKRFDAEQLETLKVKKQYEESQKMIQDVRQAITNAQKTNEIAKADMKKIQTSYEKKIEAMKEKMEELKAFNAETEESLMKMKEDCEKLTTALTQQAQRHAKEIQTREEHWLNEHKRIQKLSETAQIRVGLLEGEKEINIASRREVDILRARNLELEEKYRRIEQQAKSRFLRDKTNCLATVVQEDAMSGSGKQASIPATSIVDTSVVEQPTANAPIFPMHHRIPAVPIHAAIRQGGGSKLHEPGCSINSHR